MNMSISQYPWLAQRNLPPASRGNVRTGDSVRAVHGIFNQFFAVGKNVQKLKPWILVKHGITRQSGLSTSKLEEMLLASGSASMERIC